MKKDHVLKDFFSYPMRFADFMNALFFDGHAIIHPVTFTLLIPERYLLVTFFLRNAPMMSS